MLSAVAKVANLEYVRGPKLPLDGHAVEIQHRILRRRIVVGEVQQRVESGGGGYEGTRSRRIQVASVRIANRNKRIVRIIRSRPEITRVVLFIRETVRHSPSAAQNGLFAS